MSNLAYNVKNTGIEILTDRGFVSFSGMLKTSHSKTYTVKYTDGQIKCSASHRVKLVDGSFKCAKDLIKDDKLFHGQLVTDISTQLEDINLYDLSDVDGNDYITADITSHNCHMLSSDALLIKSTTLQELKARQPLHYDKGFAFWKEIDPKKTYVVGVDVAEGMGQDFSTIQVFELESMEQMAEMRDNKIKEDKLYDAIKWILEKLISKVDPQTHKPAEVYWSFENNSAGAVIGALYRNDEKFPDTPQLITIGEKLGMRTTSKSKIESCRNFKNMVEKIHGGFVINSEKLIFEMKNYVQRGASYAAKDDCTDDLVSACLIVTRVLKYLSAYEQDVFDKIYKSEGDFYDETTSEYAEPIPFSFSGGGGDDGNFQFS